MKRFSLVANGILSGMLTLALCACGSGGREDVCVENPNAEGCGNGFAPEAEEINAANNPDIFGLGLERRFDKLPAAGEAKKIPWPGSYWPTYQDSINVKWEGPGTDSPVAKYQKAFGVSGNLEDIVSRAYGIDSQRGRKLCKEDSECDYRQGESCAKRDGKAEGRCIPGWFGLCHAWGPASILEPEPIKDVTVNNVTFKVSDLKALSTFVYNAVETRFLSQRCNASGDANEIPRDASGRPLDTVCRDTNPGAFHIVIANFLGLKGQSFVEDRTYDAQVWNQPMRGYEVQESREVSTKEAMDLIENKQDETYERVCYPDCIWPVPQDMDKVEFTVEGLKDEAVEFTLELDVAGNKQTIKDRTTSKNERKRFGPFEVKPGDKVYATLKVATMYDAVLYEQFRPMAGLTRDYAFNPNAKKLVYVRLVSRYISESHASETTNLAATIDRYTRDDYYNYILELNGRGEIIGGEWVGGSHYDHPDFLWLPVKQNAASISGISYSKVKDLLNQSVAP